MSPLRSRHLATFVLPLALAACSADPATPPPFTPGTSASSPSASATVHAETAEEFIRRWEAAGDAMQLDGDTTAFRSLSSENCESCTAFADSVEGAYANGGYIKYDGTRIRWIKRQAARVYDVRVASGPTEYKESEAGAVKHFDGGTVTMRLTLRRTSDGWRVLESTQLAGSAS
jgi:hypothetical protein